jgi:hypothetical protein
MPPSEVSSEILGREKGRLRLVNIYYRNRLQDLMFFRGQVPF